MNVHALELLGLDWFRPFVDKTFPIEQAGEAHRYIEERKNIGKVVLVMGG